MKKSVVCIAVSISCLFSSLSVKAEPEFRILNYDILSEGQDIGDLTRKISRDRHEHVIIEHARIKVSGWWGKIDVSSNMTEQFIGETDLIRADTKIVDGDTVYWMKIEGDGHELSGSYSEIKNSTAEESAGLVNLGLLVTSVLAPNVGEILSLSQAVLAQRETQPQAMPFSRRDFDTTLNDLPFFIQQYEGKGLPRVLNILDTENLEIVRTSLSDMGVETVLVGKQKISARHLKLSDPKSGPAHVWITNDSYSLPYIVRYTGQDDGDPIELMLKPQ